ncbi:MAG: hypothetical protein M3295_09000, partial [Chloroflexota bacterium]|nr:hypothetical protein [Chloroflexota bacterium]
MSRAERRQFQRTMGRGRTPGAAPGTPATPATRAVARSATSSRAAAAQPRATDAPALNLDRRFWTWTLIGALAGGLLLLSVSWNQVPATASLAWGAVGFAGWLVGAIAA